MKYRIFVSGVQKELKNERFAVKELISENILLKGYFSLFLFEDSPAKSKSAKNTYIGEMHKSDIYIGMLGNEYGAVGRDKLSATDREFREAQRGDKAILIYIKGRNDSKRDPKIGKLIGAIKNDEDGYKYKRFDSVLELKQGIYESLIEFLREKGIVGKTAFEQSVCKSATFDDLDNGKMRWFLGIAKRQRNLSLDLKAPVKDGLTHLNLLNKGRVTNAAVLLFGKTPHEFYLQAEVKCVQFSGTEVEKPFASYHIYNGNLFEQIDKSVAFVLGAIKLPVIQQKHTVQVKRPHEIPVFAIQEAIVNAVAHRDYNSNAGVQVMVFIDRIEIWNPGGLPSQLTIDLLKKPHASHPNNPLLARVLYLADYIQKIGSGTLEMVKQCKNQGLPEPDFVSIRGKEFRTILGRDIFTENMLNKIGLNERQLKAVKYVKGKGKITNKEYQIITDVSKATATRELARLVGLKVFDQKGIVGKGTFYILKTIGS